MKILFAAMTVAVLMLTAGPSFAGRMPNHDCSGQNDACIKRCDDAAEQHKITNIDQKCRANCAQALKSCDARQQQTTDCAEEFTLCIKIESTESGKENCREAYRICKKQK